MSQRFILQQKSALEKSYDSEIKAPRNYISSIVLNLEEISRSLILIEDFRDRIKTNQRILSQNKKTYFVEEKSLFGFKLGNNSFVSKMGLAKTQIKSGKLDTFFSNYFTDKDIKELELNIKSQFRDKEGIQISDKLFSDLQLFANKVVKQEIILKDDSEKKSSPKIIEAHKKNLSLARANLRKQILGFFQDEQKNRINELGFETSKFRIQSFTLFDKGDELLDKGEQFEVILGFDTNIFDPKSIVNSEKLETFLKPKFDSFLSQINKEEEINSIPEKFIHEGRNFQTGMSFFYKNHHTVKSSEVFLNKNSKSSIFDYLEKEKVFQNKFSDLALKLKDRIEFLKKEKTRVSPSKDKEFKEIYKEYKENLVKRENLAKDFSKKFEQIKKTEWTGDFEKQLVDSIFNLREVALSEYIILKFKSNPSQYEDYLSDEKFRNQEKLKWKKIREWIMDANSETISPDLKKIITNGTLSQSRSEAEVFMWQLDSSPLISEDKNNLANALIKTNKIGFIRTISDMQEGFDRIEEQKKEILIVSSIIGISAFIIAFYLSGVMVRKIQRIIKSADELGKGNLDTRFQDGGSDEFGTLTTVLNKMTTDLKHREEMLTEYKAAEDIQKGLLPTDMPSNANGKLEFGNFYKSMSGVGGDYFDFINYSNEKIAFCIGDVSNHGIGPALIMVSLRSQLHGLIRSAEPNLRKIVLDLNEQIYNETPSHIFITFFLGIYEIRTGIITYYNCGHSKPIVYNKNTNSIKSFNSGGMPLGAIDNDIFDSTIEEEKIKLEIGDVFFQYTDGVNEAMNFKSELFGTEAMEKIILEKGKENPSIITKEIAVEVEKFSGKKIFVEGPSELNDDIAMIAFKRIE